MIKRTVTNCAILIGLLSLLVMIYVYHITPAEKWLLWHRKMATEYAQNVLNRQYISTLKVPDEMIDIHIVKNNDMVTFDNSNYATDKLFMVAYSPKHVPEPVQSNNPNRMITWRKLQKDWYELNR